MTVRKFIFILIFNSIFFSSWGQSAKDVLVIADKQYESGNYTVALKEYQRYLFFEPASNARVFSNIAECFRNLRLYNQAEEFYDKAFFTFQSDTLRYQALFKKIDCYIRTNNFGLALSELLSINDTLKGDRYFLREFYCGICYYGMEDFKNAGESFVNSIDPKYKKQRDEITFIFSDTKKFMRPNSHTAMNLSMLIPGLGQLYAGDVKNSLNSLLLLSVFVYWGINIAISQTALEGLVTIMPWFQRYYMGGYNKAETIAIEKRASNRAKIYRKVIQTVADTKS